MTRRPEIIPPDAYPQPVPREDAEALAQKLRAESTARQAMQAAEHQAESLRMVIRRYADALQQTAGDSNRVYAIAHEMRGFAATAGLDATGRIADGLVRYLDRLKETGGMADPTLLALHVSAIARAAHAEDEAGRMSDTVANELAALVRRKLKEQR